MMAASEQETTARPIVCLALFGLGRAGKIHFQSLVRNVRIDLKYIVELDECLAQIMVNDYRLKDTQTLHPDNINVVLEDASIMACVIATPTESHEEIVMACLNARKAVFCEKPLANSAEAIGKSLLYGIDVIPLKNIKPFEFVEYFEFIY